MKKKLLLSVLVILCLLVSIILKIIQIYHPHPYRGLIGNVLLIIGFVIGFIIDRKSFKLPFYDPDRKKYLRNLIIFLVSCIVVIIVIVFLFLNKG